MITVKRSIAMLFAGTAAGVLGGFLLMFRAGLFGFCLTLTVVLVRRAGWRWFAFLPGIALGIGLGFFPVQLPDFGPPDLNPPPSTYDYITALNCTLFMPIYAYAYLRPKYWSRIWRLFAAGYLSSLLRSLSPDPLYLFENSFFYLFIGILPFFVLWLLLLWTIDPHFIIKKNAGETL